MMHWNLGWGEMMIGGLGMLALWALILGPVFWGIRGFSGTDGNSRVPVHNASPLASNTRPTPLEIVQGRYVSGEISREEYEAIRHGLNST